MFRLVLVLVGLISHPGRTDVGQEGGKLPTKRAGPYERSSGLCRCLLLKEVKGIYDLRQCAKCLHTFKNREYMRPSNKSVPASHHHYR